ncbi:hypothetical protein K443DRAFT_682896 [Laccaria amethystina LaAM-08-1]|uniref:Uncharacterized protein n=1 Tax=Laccaria amethystina LaAM-08-1 TaxID=1095629 RepID=A0A0C9WU28_9AGAR|nr:hypothetical protein K443DRAFT_682896 [Laccaria amethystina LaAM-08-1]
MDLWCLHLTWKNVTIYHDKSPCSSVFEIPACANVKLTLAGDLNRPLMNVEIASVERF